MSGPGDRATVAGGGSRPARPASWRRMAFALAGYEFRLVLRRGEGLLITFVIPVGVLLVFSAFDRAAGRSTDRPWTGSSRGRSRLAVIAAALVSLAISTGFERQYGVIKRLGGSPAGSSVVVAAKTASVVIVEIVQLVLLVGTRGGGAGVDARAGRVAAARPGRARAGHGRVRGLGLLIAGTLRAEATLALANLLFLVSLVIGGIVVPLDQLPAPWPPSRSTCPPAPLTYSLAIGLGSVAGDAMEPMVILAGWAASSSCRPPPSDGTDRTDPAGRHASPGPIDTPRQGVP